MKMGLEVGVVVLPIFYSGNDAEGDNLVAHLLQVLVRRVEGCNP